MSIRRFEFVEGGSSKFWEIEIQGQAFHVRWGRLGTDGQKQTKSFSSDDEATKQAQKLIAEKLKKGYTEVTGTAAPTNNTWTHPDWGAFEHDDIDWIATIDIPAFAQFSYDTGFPNAPASTGKHELKFICHDEIEKPSAAQVKIAQAVIANQATLVKTIAKALWDDITGKGPGSGMYWNGNMEELAQGLDSPHDAPKNAEDLLKLLSVCSINILPKDDDQPVLAEICFHAAFEEEHGVGVLTNAKKILGIGYMSDVQPFDE